MIQYDYAVNLQELERSLASCLSGSISEEIAFNLTPMFFWSDIIIKPSRD